jgi:hypothetical protein
MKMKTNADQCTWRIVAVLAGALALASTGVIGVYAVPPHPPGEEEEGGANNLSVPAIFVPDTAGSPFTGICTTGDDSQDPIGPLGVDTDGDGVPDEHLDYYVQGVALWQADCDIAAPGDIDVIAEWGDNLSSAPLKAGTPIRVEIGFLTITDLPMPGYEVVKLDPTLLDRESHYGTLGDEIADFVEVRVWDSLVTLDIRSKDGTVVVADNEPYLAEINSTGRVVYGFNWQKPVSGEYTVTVSAPNINIGSADAGIVVDNHTVTLDVTVGNKGGGGGNKGGGGRPGGVTPGGGGGGGGQGGGRR